MAALVTLEKAILPRPDSLFAHRRGYRIVRSVRFLPLLEPDVQIFWPAADSIAITADQFCAHRCPAHAAGAWIERRHGAAKNSRNFAAALSALGCRNLEALPSSRMRYRGGADYLAARPAPTLADITAFVAELAAIAALAAIARVNHSRRIGGDWSAHSQLLTSSG